MEHFLADLENVSLKYSKRWNVEMFRKHPLASFSTTSLDKYLHFHIYMIRFFVEFTHSLSRRII